MVNNLAVNIGFYVETQRFCLFLIKKILAHRHRSKDTSESETLSYVCTKNLCLS